METPWTRSEGIMSQLKLTLTRDPRVPTTLTKVEEVKVPTSSSVAVVNVVGGAKPSSPPAHSTLTQTQLFTGNRKSLPVVPRLKSDTAVFGRTNPDSQCTSEKIQSPQRVHHTKPSHMKPGAGYNSASQPLPFLHVTTQQSSHTKSPPSRTKSPPSRPPHTNAPPSRSPHTKSPPSQVKALPLQSPSSKPPPLQSAHAKLPPSSSPHLKRPPNHSSQSPLAKVPPSHSAHVKLPPSQTPHAKLAPLQCAHSKSALVKSPPLLSKVAGKNTITSSTGSTTSNRASTISNKANTTSNNASYKASSKANTAEIKTITVKLPPSLVGRSLSFPVMTSSAVLTSRPNPTYALPNTSQAIMVKFPPSLITSSALPLLKTPATAPSTHKEDPALSPPKAKKAKVTKTALLPISRIKTIMKTNVQSSQPSLQISQDSVLVIAKAAVSLLAYCVHKYYCLHSI